MLRVHLMQNWFGYSDPGMEEVLYEIAAMRHFAGLNLSDNEIPDETMMGVSVDLVCKKFDTDPLAFLALTLWHCSRKVTGSP